MRLSLPLNAFEIRGIVGTAGPLPSSHLRIWTKGACPVRDAICLVRCNDSIRRYAALDPLLDYGNRVELVGGSGFKVAAGLARLAMHHARHHEQAIEVLDISRFAKVVDYAFVVVDAVLSGYLLIV